MGLECYLCRRKTSETNRISLHEFPKEPVLRKKWLEACNLSPSDNVDNINICSLHFAPKVIKRGPDSQSKYVLKSDAVPSMGITNTTYNAVCNDEPKNVGNNLNYNIKDNDVEANDVNKIASQELPLPANTANKDTKNCYSRPNIKICETPYYFLEINPSDFKTPERSRILNLVRDKIQTKMIKTLQDRNRELENRVAELEKTVEKLMKKETSRVTKDALRKKKAVENVRSLMKPLSLNVFKTNYEKQNETKSDNTQILVTYNDNPINNDDRMDDNNRDENSFNKVEVELKITEDLVKNNDILTENIGDEPLQIKEEMNLSDNEHHGTGEYGVNEGRKIEDNDSCQNNDILKENVGERPLEIKEEINLDDNEHFEIDGKGNNNEGQGIEDNIDINYYIIEHNSNQEYNVIGFNNDHDYNRIVDDNNRKEIDNKNGDRNKCDDQNGDANEFDKIDERKFDEKTGDRNQFDDKNGDPNEFDKIDERNEIDDKNNIKCNAPDDNAIDEDVKFFRRLIHEMEIRKIEFMKRNEVENNVENIEESPAEHKEEHHRIGDNSDNKTEGIEDKIYMKCNLCGPDSNNEYNTIGFNNYQVFNRNGDDSLREVDDDHDDDSHKKVDDDHRDGYGDIDDNYGDCDDDNHSDDCDQSHNEVDDSYGDDYNKIDDNKSNDNCNGIDDDSSDCDEVIFFKRLLHELKKRKMELKKNNEVGNSIEDKQTNKQNNKQMNQKEKRQKRPLQDRAKYESMFNIVYFKTLEDAKAELLERPNTEYYKNAAFKCNVCYAVFKYQKLVDYHMKWHYPSAGDHVCNICKMRFPTRQLLWHHMRNCHCGRYSCKMCPLVTCYKSVMRSHNHNYGNLHKCKFCDIRPLSQKAYLKHLRRFHQTRARFVCRICTRIFDSRDRLQWHKAIKHQVSYYMDRKSGETTYRGLFTLGAPTQGP